MSDLFEYARNQYIKLCDKPLPKKNGLTQIERQFEQFNFDEPRFFILDNSLDQNNNKSFSYNPIDDSFTPITPLPNLFKDSGVIIKGKNIFLVNGQLSRNVKGEIVDNVSCYSIENDNWTLNCFNNHSMARRNSVVLGNFNNSSQAFQFGGVDIYDKPIKFVGIYDFFVMKYDMQTIFPHGEDYKIFKGATTMGVNFLFTQSSHGICFVWDHREFFLDTEKINIDFICNRNHDYSVATSNYSIFLSGGSNMYGEVSDDFYEFDIRMMSGFYRKKMPSKRCYHGSFVFEKQLYVLGGTTDEGDRNSCRNIDIIDVPGGDWRLHSTKLPCYIDCKMSVFNDDYFL